MGAHGLTEVQFAAIQRAVQFWLDRWDWESPLLFGLSKHDFAEAALAGIGSQQSEGVFIVAAQGALRELLHGASAIRVTQIPAILGISAEEAMALIAKVSEQCGGEI